MASNGVILPRNEDELTRAAEVTLRRRGHDIRNKAERARKLKVAKLEMKKQIMPKGPISLERIVKASRRRLIDKRRHRQASKRELPRLLKHPAETHVFLVVRNLESNASPATAKKLKELNLRKLAAAIFLPNDKEALQHIKFVEPYVFYGHVTPQTIRDLLVKRGYVTIEDKESPLSNNLIVEESFGNEGILSVEDMVHEVYTNGPVLSMIRARLSPFKLEIVRQPER